MSQKHFGESVSLDQDGQNLVQVILLDRWAICSSLVMISGSQMSNNRNDIHKALSIELDLKTESGVLLDFEVVSFFT